MRLGLYYAGSAPEAEVTWYNIGIMRGEEITMTMFPPPPELSQLHALMPKIEAMAQQVLGSDFLRISTTDSIPVLELAVRLGTSRGEKKYLWNNLRGWIALCNLEPPTSPRQPADHSLSGLCRLT